MSTLLQARQMMQAGNYQSAREIIEAVIRSDPNNAEAWQLAMDAAIDDQARSEAHEGLQRALGNAALMPAPSAQPTPQQPMPSSVGVPVGGINAMQFPQTKDYLPEALITLALYIFGAGVIGMIANVYFLMKARSDRDNGIEVFSIGCLNAMLIVNGILLLLGCVIGAFILLAPLLFAGTSGGF